MISLSTKTATTPTAQGNLQTAPSSAHYHEVETDWYRQQWVDGKLMMERWVEPSAWHARKLKPPGYHKQGYWKPYVSEVRYEDSKVEAAPAGADAPDGSP